MSDLKSIKHKLADVEQVCSRLSDAQENVSEWIDTLEHKIQLLRECIDVEALAEDEDDDLCLIDWQDIYSAILKDREGIPDETVAYSVWEFDPGSPAMQDPVIQHFMYEGDNRYGYAVRFMGCAYPLELKVGDYVLRKISSIYAIPTYYAVDKDSAMAGLISVMLEEDLDG